MSRHIGKPVCDRKVYLVVGFLYHYEVRDQCTMYKRLPVKKLSGSELFKNSGNKKFSVLEFWQYGFSNLNSNVLRGVLAEFLVENALKDVSNISIRNPWGDCDVIFEEKTKIEVKCCSYIQDWDQKELSKISFAGLKAKTLYWSSAVSEFPREPEDYKSDIYILALLKHQDPETLNILDMNQWCFYVLPKDELKRITKNGKSISIGKLEKHNIRPIHFTELKDRVSTIKE